MKEAMWREKNMSAKGELSERNDIKKNIRRTRKTNWKKKPYEEKYKEDWFKLNRRQGGQGQLIERNYPQIKGGQGGLIQRHDRNWQVDKED